MKKGQPVGAVSSTEMIIQKISLMKAPVNIGAILLWIMMLTASTQSSLAQVTTLQNWSALYNNTSTSQQNLTYTVAAGSGTSRLLAVAIASSQSTVGSRTVTITYGGRSLTAVSGDMNNSNVRQHTVLYYLKEADLDLASNSTLAVTVSGGTTRVTTVWAALFDYVDQTTPIVAGSQNYNGGTSNTQTAVFGTSLSVGVGDQAVTVISSIRSGNTSPRTHTYTSNWTMIDEETWTNTDGVRNGVANRAIPATATTDNASVSISGNSIASMTGMVINACTQATASAGDALTAICKGGTSAALGGSVGGPATGGTWSDGGAGGSFSPNATTLNATYTPPSSFTGTVTLTLTTSGGTCGVGTASKTLVVNAVPTLVTASASTTAICSGESINLTSSATSNSGTSGTALSNNFNGSAGTWTLNNASTGGTPANAAWTIRSSGYNDGNETFTTSDATQFIMTSSDLQGSGGTTNTSMVTTSFSTVGFSAASIALNHYFRYNFGTDDRAYVEASTNGTNWTTLQTYSSTQGTASAFSTANISLTAGFLGQSTVYLRFRYTGSFDWYWAINAVTVNATYTTAPAATYSWTSSPAGYTSTDQNPTGIAPTVNTTYTVTATNSFGCTSTANTNLVTVNTRPVSPEGTNDTRCGSGTLSISATAGSGETIDWYAAASSGTPLLSGSTSFTTPSISTTTIYYAESRNTTTGCTSLSRAAVTATVNSATSSSQSVSACDTYTWNGNTYTTSGTYTWTGTNAAGCDSVATLVLTINNSSSSTTNLAICANQLPYSWNSNSYSAAGTYSVTLTNAANCDSVATLNLTVNNTSNSTTNVTICSNQLPYSWNGNSYSVAGTYSVTLTNAANCDSVATLVLSVTTSTSDTTTVTVCGSYTWSENTQTYTSSGTYTYNNGCDIEVLVLTIINNSASDTTATACASFTWYTNTYTTSGDYTRTLTNAAGCDSVITLHLTINPLPTAPGVVSGQTEVCTLIGSSTPTTYSVTPVEGISNYNWTIPTGVTIVSGQGTNAIDVTFTNALATTSQRIRVYTVSDLGCFGLAASSFTTLTKTAPPRANFTGPLNVCSFVGQNTTATYTCDSVARATTYNWTVSSGATIVSGQGTRTIQVQYASNYTAGSIAVTSIGSCGSISPLSQSVQSLRPAMPNTISGSTSACSFITASSQATYTIDSVSGAASYLWVLPAGVNVVSGQGTTALTVTFAPNFVSANIMVRSVSNCGTSNNRLLLVNGRNYAAPSSLTGPTNACAYINSEVQATYITRKVANAPGYLWTVPQGVTIISHPGGTGVNDTIINVTFDSSFVFGSQILVQSSGCGLSAARSLTISGSIPTRPGAITGPVNACTFMESVTNPSGNTATYTIRKNPAASYYIWTAPTNGSIVSRPGGNGENDTIALIKFNSSFLTGTVQVRAANACGISQAVSLTVSRLNVGMPGLIDVILLGECPNRSYRYSLSSMPSNATSVAWTVPQGATITSGQGTPTITVSYPSSVVTGSVTAQALNNCSGSGFRYLNVKLQACVTSLTGGEGNASLSKTAAMQDSEAPASAEVYPNPSPSGFQISLSGFEGQSAVKVVVTDLQGRTVKQATINANRVTAFGSDLKPGTYMLQLSQGGRRVVKKIQKL